MPEPTRTGGQSLTEMKARRYSEPAMGRRSVRRPEEIQRDVRGLKLRQRVSLVLRDEYLRHELEDTVRKHGDEGEDLASVRTYQDFLVPTSNYYGAGPGISVVHPINDIRGTDTLNYTKSERILRCKLASAYRLIDHFGWTESIYNHCTVRCPGERGLQGESFLINPHGLLFHEITASGLVKIDSEGNTLDPGSTNCGINKSGFIIHSAIHMARKDAKCVIHVHDPATVAVASMKQGLLPLTMMSAMLGPISYHDFEGISVDVDERERIQKDFPSGSKVLVLRNHGIVCVGETVEEAFYLTFYTVKACDVQVKAMAAGVDNLVLLSNEVVKKVHECEDCDTKKSNAKLSPGMREFEAWMRMLDAQGLKTGYVYHTPDIYNRTVQQPKSDARSPATMTSYRYEMLHGDNQTTPSRRARSQGKGNTYKNRAKWLNSPVKGTEYRKEFIQDSHTEPAILKDSKPEKETVVKILEESKGPPHNEKIVQESITSSKPAQQVMSEIPLESIFNDEPTNDSVFIEKGSNGGETKEPRPGETVTSTSTRVVTTSRTVVKSDGSPATTVETKKVIVNGEEQPVNSNLLSPPPTDAHVEVEEKENGSEEGDKGEGEKDEGEGSGKQREKVKKKRSFKKSFQGIMNRKSKSDKDDDEKK